MECGRYELFRRQPRLRETQAQSGKVQDFLPRIRSCKGRLRFEVPHRRRDGCQHVGAEREGPEHRLLSGRRNFAVDLSRDGFRKLSLVFGIGRRPRPGRVLAKLDRSTRRRSETLIRGAEGLFGYRNDGQLPFLLGARPRKRDLYAGPVIHGGHGGFAGIFADFRVQRRNSIRKRNRIFARNELFLDRLRPRFRIVRTGFLPLD